MDHIFALFRTPLGRFLSVSSLIFLAFFFYYYAKPRPVQPSQTNVPAGPATTANVTTFETQIQPPPRTMATPPPAPRELPKPAPSAAPLPRTPMAIFVSQEQTVSDQFAAFGRLLKCQLVNTVDSSRIQTPIIALAIEDLWQNGHLIVPAGTEVHGSAQGSSMRDRVASNSSWNLVFQDGREIKVSGLALDEAPDEKGWQITDGSAGLKGYTIQSDPNRELKLIFASMLQGAARGAQDQIQSLTPFGTVASTQTGSFQNALAAGIQSGTQQYTQILTQQVAQDPYFVRVPAGKTFYLYISQTLDLAKASIGGSEVDATTIIRPKTLP